MPGKGKKSQPEKTEISKEDATCPICQELFDVPILLPCKHRICEDCLMGIVDHSNIECPFCRKRLNTWVRTNKFSKFGCKKFIDKKFMEKVKILKEEIGDSDLEEEHLPLKNISKPGEVGDEFRQEQAKLDKTRQEAENENLAFIQKLLKEAAVLASVLALYGCQVVPRAICWCQVVTRWPRVVPGCCRGFAGWL